MKVFIMHVPAGSGHQKAAEAVAAALQASKGNHQVQMLDALDKADRWYRWCFTDGYLQLIQKARLLWGVLYGLSDIPFLTGLSRWVHRVNNAWHGKGLEDFLSDQRPDVVIGTHFFPMEVAAFVKRSRRIDMKLITVITDYVPHTWWTADGIDLYVVGSSITREDLLKRGIPDSRIQVLGVPIHPKFSRSNDRASLANRFGLDPEKPTVLIGSGGLGTGPIVSLVQLMEKVPKSLQLLVVAGKNETLFRQLEALRPLKLHSMKVYGFIDNMDELMDVSDLMITKPGGLTCAEAAAKGLALIFICPIPGQESRNLRVMEEIGFGITAHRLADAPVIVTRLFENRQELDRIRRKAREIGLPRCAEQIAELVA